MRDEFDEESELETVDGEWEVNTYPNPFSNQITISLSGSAICGSRICPSSFGGGWEEAGIRVMDMLGKVVVETTTTASEITLGNGLARGMYNIMITSGDNRKMIKVIKE